MLMPSIKKGESENDYVKRCTPIRMKEKGESRSKAAAACRGMYKQHKKTGKQYNGVEFYEEGMEIEEGKTYAFTYGGDAGNTSISDDSESIAMQATDGKGYKATILIGDRFMHGVFVDARELEKAYKGWNNTLHDLNHMGSGYRASMFTVIPSDISYIVGYQDNLTYNKTTKAIEATIHIDKEAERYSVWLTYANICNQINRPPNVSVFYYGQIRWIKARDLPKNSHYQKNGFKADDTVPCVFNIQPFMVSTVTKGMCNDKDGCGIKNSNSGSCEDNTCGTGSVPQDEETTEESPENAERRAYLDKRIKQMKRKNNVE